MATFTTREVEQLISDTQIPPERQVQYALKAIAKLRHGEVAGLCWRHYDPTLEPLGRLLAAWKLSHWERIYDRAPTSEDRDAERRFST